MSVQAITWAWEREGVTPAGKLVLLALADNANESTGWIAWPSLTNLAKRSNLSRQGVVNALGQLEELSLIERLPPHESRRAEVEFGITEKKSTIYRLLVPPSEIQPKQASKADEAMFLYVAHSGPHVKVGITKNLKSRESSLRTATPNGCEFVYAVEGGEKKIRALEIACHAELFDCHKSGEWFEIDIHEACDRVMRVCERASQLSGPDQSTQLTPPVNSVDPNLKEPSKNQKKNSPKPRSRISYPSDFEEFWKGYPTSPTMSKKEALSAWKKLSDEQKAQATASLPAWRSDCKKNEWRDVLHACRYLKQERFAGFVEAGQVDVSAEQVTQEQITRAYRLFRKGVMEWPESLGPPPGQPGCLVPPEIQQNAAR